MNSRSAHKAQLRTTSQITYIYVYFQYVGENKDCGGSRTQHSRALDRDDQSRRSPDEGGEDLGLGGKFKGRLWVGG